MYGGQRYQFNILCMRMSFKDAASNPFVITVNLCIMGSWYGFVQGFEM